MGLYRIIQDNITLYDIILDKIRFYRIIYMIIYYDIS